MEQTTETRPPDEPTPPPDIPTPAPSPDPVPTPKPPPGEPDPVRVGSARRLFRHERSSG
jgi:hypothetical protein